MAKQSSLQAKDVQDQAHDVMEEIASLAELLKSLASGTGEDLRDGAAERLEEVARRAQALAGQAKVRARSELASLEGAIVEKPLQSAAIAFGLGLLLGVLTRR